MTMTKTFVDSSPEFGFFEANEYDLAIVSLAKGFPHSFLFLLNRFLSPNEQLPYDKKVSLRARKGTPFIFFECYTPANIEEICQSLFERSNAFKETGGVCSWYQVMVSHISKESEEEKRFGFNQDDLFTLYYKDMIWD